MHASTGTLESGFSTLKRSPEEGVIESCLVAKTDTLSLVTKRMPSGALGSQEAINTLAAVSPTSFLRYDLLMAKYWRLSGGTSVNNDAFCNDQNRGNMAHFVEHSRK
jgi:hypothetical protein